MRQSIYIFSILALIFFIFPKEVKALGGYLTGDYGQVAPVEVKAIIDYDGKTETITSSQTFSFNPLVLSNFYWVMAYPTKVEIKKLDSKENVLTDSFLEIEKKTVKKFSKDNFFKKLLYPDLIEEETVPSQTFSRMALIKYIKEVPDFKNMKELEAWFKANAYSIPKNSRELFAEYLKKNWHFVLAVIDGLHVEMDAKESLTISAAHNIPIQAKFRTENIIYPLKLVAIQPDRDSISVPLSFPYGSSAESILGVKDARANDLLSTQSSSMYPPLLLDLATLKIDLFIRTKYKVEAKGFTTVFADKEGDKFLTRIIGYKPMTQLEDVKIVKAKDQKRVNPQVSVFENIVRLVVVVMISLVVIRLFMRSSQKS